MRRKMVAGNWKMNGSRSSASALLKELMVGMDGINNNDVVVFPPYVHLAETQAILSGSVIAWGAQSVSEFNDGAYTGEISAAMLMDLGCRYVLVGHSERRSLYHESNTVVANKFAKAWACGLIPVLCVGETLAQREQDKTFEVIIAQIEAVLALESGVRVFEKAIIAYEPVWAIGTGLSATPAQAEAVHQAIRAHIAKRDSGLADQCRILYGGSVKADNAAQLFAMPNIDGALVGGASLKANDFLEICKAATI